MNTTRRLHYKVEMLIETETDKDRDKEYIERHITNSLKGYSLMSLSNTVKTLEFHLKEVNDEPAK